MNYPVVINGREHILTWSPKQGPKQERSCTLDGVGFSAEVLEVAPGTYSLLIAGQSFLIRVAAERESATGRNRGVGRYQLQIEDRIVDVAVRDPRRRASGPGASAVAGTQRITAPMAGKVVRILVAEKQNVEAGQSLLVVEAMKMQNEIRSPNAGVVQSVPLIEGQAVEAGQVLLTVE